MLIKLLERFPGAAVFFHAVHGFRKEGGCSAGRFPQPRYEISMGKKRDAVIPRWSNTIDRSCLCGWIFSRGTVASCPVAPQLARKSVKKRSTVRTAVVQARHILYGLFLRGSPWNRRNSRDEIGERSSPQLNADRKSRCTNIV